MKETEMNLRDYLLNKKITDIMFFNVNDAYFDYADQSMWVIDGGVQLELDDGVFAIGWNFDQESFDVALGSDIDTLLGDSSEYEIDLKSNTDLRTIVGAEIMEIDFEWDFYQEFDEDGALMQEKIYFPVMILLRFRLGESLQLALIDFDIDAETQDLVNPVFNLAGQLLISHSKQVRINYPDQE